MNTNRNTQTAGRRRLRAATLLVASGAIAAGRDRNTAEVYGFIDGAVRSGERVAAEVIQREAMTVA
jgi:monoamine oxidase